MGITLAHTGFCFCHIGAFPESWSIDHGSGRHVRRSYLPRTRMPTPVRPVLRAGLVLGCALVLAACGSKREGATQVAAKVNKEEISVHQINFLMQRQGNLKPEQVE